MKFWEEQYRSICAGLNFELVRYDRPLSEAIYRRTAVWLYIRFCRRGIPTPTNSVEYRYYRVMKEMSRSAVGTVEQAMREKEEYCDYVESWIHQIKTPLTACSLLFQRISIDIEFCTVWARAQANRGERCFIKLSASLSCHLQFRFL